MYSVIKINSGNVLDYVTIVKDLKDKNPGHRGCWFEVTPMANSSSLLVRMYGVLREPFMQLDFTASNYKFRTLFLDIMK